MIYTGLIRGSEALRKVKESVTKEHVKDMEKSTMERDRIHHYEARFFFFATKSCDSLCRD